MPEPTGGTPATTEPTLGERAYRRLLDHLEDCRACHTIDVPCSTGDRLRQLTRVASR